MIDFGFFERNAGGDCFADDGGVGFVVGFFFEADAERVRGGVGAAGVEFPVALDDLGVDEVFGCEDVGVHNIGGDEALHLKSGAGATIAREFGCICLSEECDSDSVVEFGDNFFKCGATMGVSDLVELEFDEVGRNDVVMTEQVAECFFGGGAFLQVGAAVDALDDAFLLASPGDPFFEDFDAEEFVDGDACK